MSLVPEWNFWERIALYGLEDNVLEKGIKTEEQKFIHNVNKTFVELEKILNTNLALYREKFTNSFLNQKEIINSSINPKVLVYVFTTLPIVVVNYQEFKKDPTNVIPIRKVYYDENNAKKTIEDIKQNYVKDKKKKKDTKGEFSKFLIENGITPDSIIRYYRFFELNLKA
jgi:hypothetical protein